MIFAVFSLINVLYDRRHGAISLRESNLLTDLDNGSVPDQESDTPHGFVKHLGILTKGVPCPEQQSPTIPRHSRPVPTI